MALRLRSTSISAYRERLFQKMNSPGNSTDQMEGRIRFCLSDLKRCGLIPVQQKCHNAFPHLGLDLSPLCLSKQECAKP